jgi:uncharacterized membrane protein
MNSSQRSRAGLARSREPSLDRPALPASDATLTPRRAANRIEGIDSLRGLAILAMIAYHFTFDLRFFGVIRADFENDPFWLGARAAIVSSFLLLVGVSLVLAREFNVPTARFARRVAIIALCALAATMGSFVVFPERFIYFGILHCIVVASVLARPLAGRPLLALALGVAAIAAGLVLSHPFFDTRATSWIGFNTVKPPTEDFVPLFPWFGVVLLGIALGHKLVRRDFAPVAPLARAPRALRWLGRHSLVVYMLHQPILLGVLWLFLRR